MRNLKICSAVVFCLVSLLFISSVASAEDTSPYGLNDWDWTDEALIAAKESGITWMRVGGVYWNQFDTPSDRISSIMERAQKYGMKVSLIVPYTNQRSPEDFANFTTILLNRYPQISALEVFNEENTGGYDVPIQSLDAKNYVPVLKAVYQAAQNFNRSRTEKVIVTTSALYSFPVGYLEDMYSFGAKGYFDVLNFHYYSGKDSPSQSYGWLISHYRKVMQKYGDGDKPIWLTEFGWAINAEPEKERNPDNIGSPQRQLDNLAYVLDASLKSGFVKRVFWFKLTGDDGMSLIHTTDYYDGRVPARLDRTVSANDINLVVRGKVGEWPKSGLVTIDAERIRYSSIDMPQGGYPILRGLTRGVDGTIAAVHASRALVYNQDVNPELTSGILAGDSTLTITGNWTKRWPSDGVLIIDSEKIKYASSASSGSTTIFRGLTRGIDGTAPAAHSLFAKVKNQDLTAGFKRKAYYAYKNFIQANPAWNKAAPLSDVPLAASAPVTITNADFENGQADWSANITIDTTVKRSGLASAKLVNDTGSRKGARHTIIPVEPNKSYFLKAWVRIDPQSDPDMSAMVHASLLSADGQLVRWQLVNNYVIINTDGVWRQIHYPFWTPNNATQLVIYLTTSGGTGTAWFDDVSIEPYDLSHRAIMGRR